MEKQILQNANMLLEDKIALLEENVSVLNIYYLFIIYY